MSDRSITSVHGTTPQPGSGILRPFPSREIDHLDPFIFLDTGEPMHLGSADIFVAPHPHRGFQPVSLLFKGKVTHRDSLGNHLSIDSGGIQWLVAGKGAIHEETLEGDADGVFHMAQLWVNLPTELKMQDPSHHALPASTVPHLTGLGEGSMFRLYAGDLDGETGPAPLPTPVLIGHVILEPGGTITVPVPKGWTMAVVVVDGKAATAGGDALVPGDIAIHEDDGDTVTLSSDSGGQLLFLAGEPIGEPIATGGSFVMNTPEEVRQAFDDYAAGRMGSLESSR
ncbi:MAG: pirin family protein [Acidimicrobiia bacterium]